ncbi:MAG: response regulator [Halothiobacillaceae bacterium]|nr:response regulator [Halothiobacillaceae bacterium]
MARLFVSTTLFSTHVGHSIHQPKRTTVCNLPLDTPFSLSRTKEFMSYFNSLLSVFRKRPPASTEVDSGSEAQPAQSAKPQGERRKIERRNATEATRALIIDDSKTVIVTLRKFLISADYTTLEALDAESGIELARSERPDVIFLDIVLPGMNGFAALRILRRDPQTKDIPIIMMSSNEQATEQFFGDRIGADDFMKKPFSREEVFARLDKLVCADSQLHHPDPKGGSNTERV